MVATVHLVVAVGRFGLRMMGLLSYITPRPRSTCLRAAPLALDALASCLELNTAQMTSALHCDVGRMSFLRAI